MKGTSTRLFFIDAMRAWAILMMLQGHFIDGLLDPVFRNPESLVYNIWLYFRGITAPVFFTVSGFIFTYLLFRSGKTGLDNPRVKKGVKRGIQLLLIGYALRLNIIGLFKGEIYSGFYLVDVLHCIGLALLTIIGLYVLTINRRRFVFPTLLVVITLLLFLFEPIYKQWSFSFLPIGIANYFTKANGSVFTIIPWLGYATIGAALSILFLKYKNAKQLYNIAIISASSIGLGLIYFSSDFFIAVYQFTDIELFQLINLNNYLFIRLGDVFVVFAIFMLIRKWLTNSVLLKIGASTLSIYVIHFVILYGSFTGLGLYKFLHHELSPWFAVIGALSFMIICTVLALNFSKNEELLKAKLQNSGTHLHHFWKKALPIIKNQVLKARLFLLRLLASEKT